MNEQYQRLKSLVLSAEDDFAKFGKGNNAAGTRARATLQQIKELSQSLRLEIQDQKNKAK